MTRRPIGVGAARHSGNQGVFLVGEGLLGVAVPIGGIAHVILHQDTGGGLALLHQFQGTQVVRSVVGHYLHSCGQPGIGVRRHRRLVARRTFGSC